MRPISATELSDTDSSSSRRAPGLTRHQVPNKANKGHGQPTNDSSSVFTTPAFLRFWSDCEYTGQKHPYPSKPVSTHQSIWTPSQSFAFRLLVWTRLLAALYSNISDCDEVFNFWEPTHYLQYGRGLQTWEYSPVYAIRSWAYIFPHTIAAFLSEIALTKDKASLFILLRFILGMVSAYTESKMYWAVVQYVHPRVGRYMLILLLASAGMFISSTAYLPSTFAMYCTSMAFSHQLRPPSRSRTEWVVWWTGLGSLLGWPFAAAAAIPFVVEDTFMSGQGWRRLRWMLWSGIVTAGVILWPMMHLDGSMYGRLELVPFNIIVYNVFGGSSRGPHIYGTEPWWYYFANGLLNFNIGFILALAAWPLLMLTRLMSNGCFAAVLAPANTEPRQRVALRLLPFYVMLYIFSSQAHKEERFMFVVYPLICFNAALGLYCLNRVLEGVLHDLNVAKGDRATAAVGFFVLIVSSLVSASRIMALYAHYSAPIAIYRHLSREIADSMACNVTVCVGKEWYRFPSHYFLPDQAQLRFIKSEFDGLLPKYFYEASPETDESKRLLGSRRWKSREGAWRVPEGMNDLNQGVVDERYVNVTSCDYLVDSDMPSTSPAYDPNSLEPRYLLDTDTWSPIKCLPFLDSSRSTRLGRAFWIPENVIRIIDRYVKSIRMKEWASKRWGSYCALKARHSASMDTII
ncbi:hypothetical protein SeMB42_g02701 [Synchytrium endobioticum]|uniref:Mannosyltransferase n=1 Tax=Synchytrium endobioticum TaxID=286115 RepID=A0A507DD50_9FUNG|nr:hypothetical protein SeMB42_g02701 [Synchytrium endobioticum]